jgi:hypothetical protein
MNYIIEQSTFKSIAKKLQKHQTLNNCLLHSVFRLSISHATRRHNQSLQGPKPHKTSVTQNCSQHTPIIATETKYHS